MKRCVLPKAEVDAKPSIGMTAPELTPEELVNRYTDEELLGLTPPGSRPGTGNRRKSAANNTGGLSALLNTIPPSSSGRNLNSRPPSGNPLKDAGAKLVHSASDPAVGTLRPVSAAEIKAQRKQNFHFQRQRRWLEVHNKHNCLSFTEQEIIDFRRFFDALAGRTVDGKVKDAIKVDRFEDMLVCLDLARSKKDTRGFLECIRGDIVDNEIKFDAFLRAFESQLDSGTMDVLKQLLQGSYDCRDLDFLTFISERRRELIFSATGARGSSAQGPSSQIVRTFSDLLEDRCYDDFGGGSGSNSRNEDGVLLMGGLGTMWQVVCVQHQLARTLTAEERSANVKKSAPQSPRTVVGNIVKPIPKTMGVRRLGRTVVIDADQLGA